MKISKLARLAKSSGQAVLYDTGGEQWLCVGGAYYPLLGMPELNADTLPYALSLTEKEREKMTVNPASTTRRALRTESPAASAKRQTDRKKEPRAKALSSFSRRIHFNPRGGFPP